jgi:ubiquinone/menaquinone biosynthesis C-methylase UbiE
VDVVFIADAFHEFPDKQGTLMELHRILREDGVLSILEDTQGKAKKAAALAKDSGLFSLVEQDGKFRKFQKAAATHLPETSVTEEGWAAKVGRPSRSSG